MIDSRLALARRLAVEADKVIRELRDETEPGSPDGDSLDEIHTCLSCVVARTTAMEEQK